MSAAALVTCRDLPSGDEDADLLHAACQNHGVHATWEVWDDPAVNWSGYDLVVVRATWDYPARLAEFLAWTQSVPGLANPAPVIRWNTDKSYLAELAAAGVPVVPTGYLRPGTDPDTFALPTDDEYVVKPAVGCGSVDAARYHPGVEPAARDHLRRLRDTGRTAMIQPYLAGIDTAGETALFFVAGQYSHAVGKAPLLRVGDSPVDGLYREETVEPRHPDATQRAVAERALAAVPGGARQLLYARVDLIPDATGHPVVLEVELIEPSFFLVHTSDPTGAANRVAADIARRAARPEN